MKTLYISDLDGTLLNSKAQLSAYSRETIAKLIDEGMMFTIATARSQSAVDYVEQLGVKLPCVQLNGVLIYDSTTQTYVDSTPLDTDTARKIVDILHDFDRMSFVYKFDEDCGVNVEFERLSNQVETDFFNARKDQDYKSFRQIPTITVGDDEKVIYFTMVDTHERLQPIYNEIKKLPRAEATLYSDNYSDLYFLEVFSADATKANGLAKIQSLCGAERVVAFGDNLNDVGMLKLADVGAVVGDGVEEVKQHADVIIGNSNEDGVAHYLLSEWNTVSD